MKNAELWARLKKACDDIGAELDGDVDTEIDIMLPKGRAFDAGDEKTEGCHCRVRELDWFEDGESKQSVIRQITREVKDADDCICPRCTQN